MIKELLVEIVERRPHEVETAPSVGFAVEHSCFPPGAEKHGSADKSMDCPGGLDGIVVTAQ